MSAIKKKYDLVANLSPTEDKQSASEGPGYPDCPVHPTSIIS